MKTLVTSIPKFWGVGPSGLRSTSVRLTWGLAAIIGLSSWVCVQAQIQTAGTLYINVDATAGSPGLANGIANTGTLGGVFDSTNPTPLVTVSNVNAILFTNTYLWLTNRGAGGLVRPAPGMVGPITSSSIEVWALNPSVAADESVISWGARNTAANMNLEYGSGGSGGVSHNGSGNDAGWDFYGGYPAPGLWHHLVVTFDGVRSYLYSDGVLVNSYPAANALTISNSVSVLLGAQWNSDAATVSTSPGWATLALARVRVHSGVLTPAQIANNYNVEKASFPPPPQAASFLAHGPVHRYTFDEPATNDASGLTFHDAIGGADGIVQASPSFVPPTFTGRRLVLRGDISTTLGGYGHAYGDLPSGIISGNSTNNGGSGELSIELWYKNNDGVSWSWSRLFEFGSCGNTAAYPAGQQGIQVIGPGGYPSPGGFLDSFYLTAQNGNSVGQRQVGWQNKDVLPLVGGNPGPTNSSQSAVTFFAVGNYQTDRHVVVTWKESTGQIIAYDNGYFAAQLYASNSMSTLNDLNCWLGRSLNNDLGFGGEYEEVRFYTNVLTPAEVLGDFQVGPNTINTGAQAAKIATAPQSQSTYQGWPVSFYVTASGSPAVSYQWNRNSSPIPGATSDFYTIAAAASTDNGAAYSCTVSNNTGSPNVQTSTAATLTVVSNVALPPAVLFETKSANAANNSRDNYDGTVGCAFTVGSAGAIVTHLGFYDMNGDGLTRDHTVSIYPNVTGSTNPIASVVVSNGTGGYLTNFYRYFPLPTPIYLAPNTVYVLQGDTYTSDQDPWADLWQPGAWSTSFVGSNDRFTRQGRYGGHGQEAGGVNGNNNTYGAPNLAVFPMGSPMIVAVQTGVTQYVNVSATLSVAANGQAPMTCQWYKVGTPDQLLSGQTGLSLNFASLQSSDEGNYYAAVTNSLGNAKSSNIYLRVFADTAVSISQQPTNTMVLQNYSASFYIMASGTPPIGYQWYRNSSAIAGATASSYTLPAANATNNGDTYSCVVSNYANGAPHLLGSANATLTVTPNQAPAPQTLYPAIVGNRDNYSGMVGATFEVGATPAKVTHLGYFLANAALNFPHHVDIFSGDGSSIVAEVFVSGTGDVVYNNYAYVALTNPVTLAANTSYIIAGEVFSGSGDPWPDVSVPSPWNPYYVGGNPSSTRQARYGGNYPAAPTGASTTDGIYGAGNLALLPVGAPVVTMDVTNQTQYATSNATFTAFVNGQPPVVVQWFKVGSPNTQVPGQTSSTLQLNNLQTSDAGTYYLMATNGQATARGPNATLTVLPAGRPAITLEPQSQTVYVNQQATFTVAASVPPSSYQWWFNGNPIANANSSSYTVFNANATKAGSYLATLANAFGTSTSSPAVLTVLAAPPGYASTVLQLNPMVYYQFEDLSNSIATGVSNVFNLGNLAGLATGLAEGSATNGPGPKPPTWPGFGAANQALVLDPSTLDVDVKVPPLNVDPNSGPNMTLAAWINPSGPQLSFAGIIFNRGTGGASGLGIKQDALNGNADMLEYHWANNYYAFNSSLYTTNYGQWAFVALAVDPTQAVFYLNDGSGMQSVANVAAHAGVSFASPTYVGWDDNDAPGTTTTRRFAGMIDEPMIFGRTLSPSEIQALFNAGVQVQLQVSRVGNNLLLSWPTGTLEQAGQVTGTFNPVNGASSPFTNAIGPGSKFFRVHIP